jgi:hypothetical protein
MHLLRPRLHPPEGPPDTCEATPGR